MSNLFNSVRVTRPKRTAFRLGHDNYFTSSMGRLTPVLALDGVPGDTFEINCAAFARFSPLLAPPHSDVSVVHSFLMLSFPLHRQRILLH